MEEKDKLPFPLTEVLTRLEAENPPNEMCRKIIELLSRSPDTIGTMNKFFIKYDMFIGGINIASAIYQYIFGNYGMALLSLIIGVACTAIGAYGTEVKDPTKQGPEDEVGSDSTTGSPG